VEKAIQDLDSGDENSIKKVVFDMRYLLQDALFAEEFIYQQGIGKLLDVVMQKEGNVQSYALVALRGTMGYLSGLEVFFCFISCFYSFFFLFLFSLLIIHF